MGATWCANHGNHNSQYNQIPMKSTSLILPTIHSNGSSAKSLTEDYTQARRAVQEAINALQAVDFNARDYYVQGPATWTEAVRQRHDVYEHLSAAFNALHEHETHCSQFIKEIRP
jgi:hypothetical protein